MYTPHSLSSYILSGTVAALLAAGVISYGPDGLVSSDQFAPHTWQAVAEPVFSNAAATTVVDRFDKGDRLGGSCCGLR